MRNCFLKIFSILSLNALHRLGAFLGWCIFLCASKTRRIAKSNLKQSALVKDDAQFKQVCIQSFLAFGKSIVETLGIWQKSEAELLGFIKHIHGWQSIDEGLKLGKGIIFLTPHLGCFEITSIFYGAKHPITVLFRAPKLKYLQSFMEKGRTRTGITLAEANAGGVRKLMQALKRGEAIGILPDQIPAEGEGEWADFFGKPAYTMTLASKLAEKTGATVIMAFGERLANGQGYDIHLTKIDSIATPARLNQAIERQIAQMPAQYLWQYNRYKARRHTLQKQNAPLV
jgi:KDO2-lipid IV(A) lauroyltransferase